MPRKTKERKPKLVAANGKKIEVYGEAVSKFEKMVFWTVTLRNLWRRCQR